MIFTPVLCFVLALTTCSAKKPEVEELMDQIVSTVVAEMNQVAKAARADVSTQELNNQVLGTMSGVLERMAPQIDELSKLGGGKELAKELSERIIQSQELKAVLLRETHQSPRFVGALVLGITQIVTDVVNMGLRRY